VTAEMKKFLHERGLTAMDVAKRVPLYVPTDIYGILNGTRAVHRSTRAKIKDVLCRVYGMTENEYEAAMPHE